MGDFVSAVSLWHKRAVKISYWCRFTTVPLTSNLSVHACPLASDSKAARVRRPRYSRVNIRAYASAIRVTRVCAQVTSARSTCERVSIASIPRPLPPRKKVEGLGTRLACPLRVNLVHAFERERVHFRVLARVRMQVLACDSRATREGCQVARERHCIFLQCLRTATVLTHALSSPSYHLAILDTFGTK